MELQLFLTYTHYLLSLSFKFDIDLNNNNCDPNPCKNNGECIDGAFSFSCINCANGFTGLTCEESKYETMSKKNRDDLNTINVLIRNAGNLMNFFTFLDINDCDTNPCQHNGECVDGIANYTCNCVTGVFGPNCEISKYKK